MHFSIWVKIRKVVVESDFASGIFVDAQKTIDAVDYNIFVAATQPMHTVIQTKNTNWRQFSNTSFFNTTQLINTCSDTTAKINTNKY